MENTVISYLRESSIKYPQKYVCIDDRKKLTYNQLWELSDQIAAKMLNVVKIGHPFPLVMKKSSDALAIIWGVIKAGGCYAMIDPLLPQKRIENMLKILGADSVMIEDDTVEEKIKNTCDKVLYMDQILTEKSEIDCEILYERIGQICDIDPLYVMFTSGSTGEPKAVVVNHRSVKEFIKHFTTVFSISHHDILANQAPWDFDVSVKDIFSTIKMGATLRIIEKKYFSFPIQLGELLEREKVTTLIWAVSALCILSSRGVLEKINPSYINKIIFSGEIMPITQLNIWRKYYPNILFANVYGPTEITCNCTYYIIKKEDKISKNIPIGKPFENVKIFLLTEDNALIKSTDTEKIGEICVSGTGISLGYYNNRLETEKKFIQNPLQSSYREIIYKTGDLAYYDEDKNLCFVSRKDFQIKHMGHRIELSEIEKAIEKIENVKMCCCIFYKNKIVAFIEGNLNKTTILKYLRDVLPNYMVPSEIKIIYEIPINKNGKIDRKKLNDILESENGSKITL